MVEIVVDVRTLATAQAADAFREAVDRALRAEVLVTERDTKENIVRYNAIDTGTMLRSVHGQQVDDWTWKLAVPVPYAAYVNFGTRHMAARPFFSEAVEASRQRFPGRMRRAVAP